MLEFLHLERTTRELEKKNEKERKRQRERKLRVGLVVGGTLEKVLTCCFGARRWSLSTGHEAVRYGVPPRTQRPSTKELRGRAAKTDPHKKGFQNVPGEGKPTAPEMKAFERRNPGTLKIQ